MNRGNIQRLIEYGGYGFISSESDTNRTIYFNFSDVTCLMDDDCEETLIEGCPVVYDTMYDNKHKNYKAVKVSVDYERLESFEKTIPMYCFECGTEYTKADMWCPTCE